MTAKDLLYKILDYRSMWESSHTKNSRPVIVRLEQIEALQEAFGLTKKYVNPFVQIKYSISGNKEKLDRSKQLNSLTNLQYLMHGEFIRDRQYELNQELTSKAFSTITSIYTDLPKAITERPIDISWMFNNLINFRQEVFKLAYPNSGMLEGFSIGVYYSFYLQENLKKLILENLNDIDDTL